MGLYRLGFLLASLSSYMVSAFLLYDKTCRRINLPKYLFPNCSYGEINFAVGLLFAKS